MENEIKILILTPVKDAEETLESYFTNLFKLQFPHKNISLGFLESDSRDNTYSILKKKLPELEKVFRKVGLWKRDFGFQISEDTPRWAGKIQYQRRAILARTRNNLLFCALADEDWVLWLDVDVIEYPVDIIQRLLATGNLRGEGDLVKLHSVGGTMLLVKSELHRDGLIFPPFPYGRKSKLIPKTNFFFANRRDIVTEIGKIPKKLFNGEYQGEMETEGFGIMAYDMGYECWGMPNLEIRHRDE